MLLRGWKCITGQLQWLNCSWRSPGHTLISLTSNSWIWKTYWIWSLSCDMLLTNRFRVHIEEREREKTCSALSLACTPVQQQQQQKQTWEFEVIDTIYIWVVTVAQVLTVREELPSRLCWQQQHLLHLSHCSLLPSQCLAPSAFKSLSIPFPKPRSLSHCTFLSQMIGLAWSPQQPTGTGKRELKSLER